MNGFNLRNNENARSIAIAKRQNALIKNASSGRPGSKWRTASAVTALAQRHGGIGSGNPYDKMLYRG